MINFKINLFMLRFRRAKDKTRVLSLIFIYLFFLYLKSRNNFVEFVPIQNVAESPYEFNSCPHLSREFKDRLEESPRVICGCPKDNLCITKEMKPLINSTCSLEASLLGPNQKVISFGLHKTTEKKFMGFLPGILENLPLQQEFYPDWVIRVYTSVEINPGICNAVCASPNIYFCNTTNLPELGSVENMAPRTWRFLALGDPTVIKFISRDLDSRLGFRERAAVRQWEESQFPLHAMRDMLYHANPIMAGMWGADNDKLGRTFAKKMQMDIRKTEEQDDQMILDQIIYFKYRRLIMIHDSYFCKMFLDGIPFPTRRKHRRDIVGMREWDKDIAPRCPVKCRPKYGQNWTYC